jgi:hypothetical protein
MKLAKFYDNIEASDEFVGIGVDDTDKGIGVIVKHKPTNVSMRLPAEAIKKADWEMLSDVISGKREPAVLQHMTRVVGYYSRIENWNISKLGELQDRQAGNYEVK